MTQSGPAGPTAPEPAGASPLTRALALGGGGRGARERELTRDAATQVSGSRRVVIVSIKGGVGKTTTAAMVATMLAAIRRDRVTVVDASSDWGTLAARLSVVPKQTVRGFAAEAGRNAVSEQGILSQLTLAPGGLFVVGSSPQSVVDGPLTEDEYVRAMHLLGYVADVIVVDVGAGLQQAFLRAALRGADQLVVATAATWDAAQSAGAALDWLANRGMSALAAKSVVVVNTLSPARRRRRGYLGDLHADLARRCGSVHDVPFDPALQPGGRILLRKLTPATRLAYLEVAAAVMRTAGQPAAAGATPAGAGAGAGVAAGAGAAGGQLAAAAQVPWADGGRWQREVSRDPWR